MHCSTVTRVITLATMIVQSALELVIVPSDTESMVGDATYFNCSTNLTSSEIFWHHGQKHIYTGETILEPYRGRFEIESNDSIGSHNLVIHSVEPSDAGVYICIDDDGHGISRSAELIVLDNDPYCQSNIQPDGVIGQNVFNLPPDEVQLTCNVSYHGNIHPEMEWKKIGENKPIEGSTSFMSTNRLIYTLTLEGDISLDNSSYVCNTKRSTQNQYKCTSEVIKVLYFVGESIVQQNVLRGDEITCTARSNTFSCINEWHHDNYTFDETITTDFLGVYRCTVKCRVREKVVYADALKYVVIEATTSLPQSQSGTIAATAVISILIIVPVLAVAYIVRNKKRKERRHEDKQREIELLMARVAFINFRETLPKRKAYVESEGQVELLHKIKKGESLGQRGRDIVGIAILRRKLFILREKISQLEVYDCENFMIAPKLLDMKELVAAVDVCCCKKNNCLYIMDKKKGKVKEVLKINTDGELLISWPTKYNARGYLSATTEGNVIITVQDKQLLLEYSPEGKLMCKIRLPECTNPWHAVKLDSGRYIVSHGLPSDRFIRVCLVDKDGTVEKSFGPKSESAENQLNMPVYLVVADNGCLIVTDQVTNRIFLLDSNLKFLANIVPKYNQRFLNPKRVCLDEMLLAVVIAAGKPKEIIHHDEGDSRKAAEEGEFSTENTAFLREAEEGNIQGFTGKPTETIHEDEGDSRKEVEESEISTENTAFLREAEEGNIQGFTGKPTETIRQDEGDSRKEARESEIPKENTAFLREADEGTIEEVYSLKKIEVDCKLLFFDIKPLLRLYNG